MLWQYGAPVPLTPKVIQLLAALVARSGQLLKYRVVAYDGEFSGERLNQLSAEWRTA